MGRQGVGRRLCAAAAAIAAVAAEHCGGTEATKAQFHSQARSIGEVEVSPVDTARIELFYVCGSEFNVRNANPISVLLHWTVQGSADAGTLVVPPPLPGQARSETHFVTQAVGTVLLYYGNTNIRRYANLKSPCTTPSPPPPPPPPPPWPPTQGPPTASGKGQWSPVVQLPVVPIHDTVLPDGRLLMWSRLEDAAVWDWATNVFRAVPAPSWLFCASQTFLANGQILVAGGHITDDHGIRDVNLFDSAKMTWTRSVPMRAGRWYPSILNLPSGEVLVVGGATEQGVANTIPEVRRSDGTWRQLTGANLQLSYYPFMFLSPDGRVFMAGPYALSRFLDTSGTGRWINGPRSFYKFPSRNYGAALMYEPGKILLVGGSDSPPTNTVETIDLNLPTPAFRPASSMRYARRQVNATVLPDGSVLVTGGTSASGFNNPAGAVLTPELWDPVKGTWTAMAPMKVARLYHSTAVLLPDGRVFSSGGGEGGGGKVQMNGEFYSPPYLFKPDGTPASRPAIGDAPGAITYNQSFDVVTPDAANIASVALIGIPAATHGMNFNQRFQRLAFTAGAGRITATAPLRATLAPPSFYYLFLIDLNGVPSVARIVVLQ